MSVKTSAAVTRHHTNEMLPCYCPRQQGGRESGEDADNPQGRYKRASSHSLAISSRPPLNIHSGSMAFLGYPGNCSCISYRTHCYFPVTASVALCSNDVSPTFGLSLPSSYHGNLWLLDNCQETCGEVPSCDPPSSEPKTCTTSCDRPNSSVPCSSPAGGQTCSARETTLVGASPSCDPCPQTKGYVSDGCTPSPCASKACQTLGNGFKCFGQLNRLSESFQPRSHYRLGSFGYRSYQNLGFIPSGFSPSRYITNSCQRQNYLIRNCQCPYNWHRGCPPLSYFSRNFRSLSSIPSSFPPLRYLYGGYRPLNCYRSNYCNYSC